MLATLLPDAQPGTHATKGVADHDQPPEPQAPRPQADEITHLATTGDTDRSGLGHAEDLARIHAPVARHEKADDAGDGSEGRDGRTEELDRHD